MKNKIILMDASRLAQLIAARELSPVEVVQAHLDRIAEVNPKVNAIVALADGAMEAARKAEAAGMAGGQVGPLHGVPFTAKDGIDAAGVLTQRGSPIFKGRVADTDATVVARIKAAGGILIAKTNPPEFSYSIETDNLLTGRTNNPWNLDYTPGGSSGGESAAIAAGMSPLGTGQLIFPFPVRGPGGTYRHRRVQTHPRARAYDGTLAPGTTPLLAHRADGALRPRCGACLFFAGRA